MLLTITTTREPATDLGYLLYKNPARVQNFSLSFGDAHVVYPEASDERCTAALILDVDPVEAPEDGVSVRTVRSSDQELRSWAMPQDQLRGVRYYQPEGTRLIPGETS